MYEQFFGLRERPFDLTPNPRYLVLTESHREALSNLEYGIASRKGITLLVGEAGSGKTTVIRAAIAKQPAPVHTVHLHNPTLSRQEFGQMLAIRFGLSEKAARSKTSMLIELEALLKSRHAQGETTRPHRGRGAQPVDGAARGNPPAGEHRDRRRKADAGDHRRSA